MGDAGRDRGLPRGGAGGRARVRREHRGPWEYDSAEDRFRGRVGSFEAPCEKRRLVKVQEAKGSGWETVGKARSNRNARWHLEMTDAKGTFRIVIRPRRKVTIEHDHRCDRYASQGVEIGR